MNDSVPGSETVHSSAPTQQQQKLEPSEYQRRKAFSENIRNLTKPEYIEMVRILKNHEINFSENQNGIFFNIATLPQIVFDDLEKFLNFTQVNRRALSDRDTFLSTLATQCTTTGGGEAATA
jgi:hypothetical protein